MWQFGTLAHPDREGARGLTASRVAASRV